MANTTESQSQLLRLPREVRDQIYRDIFGAQGGSLGDDSFPIGLWSNIQKGETYTLFEALPGICRASRQMFLESTPIYIGSCNIHSNDGKTTQHLFDFLSQIPDDEGFKCVKSFAVWDWMQQETPMHLKFMERCTNLEYLDLVFGFDDFEDGESEEKYSYPNEKNLWVETGLHYEPQDGRTVEEELAKLAQDTQDFIQRFDLERVLALPKLDALQFQFQDNTSGEYYRHRLCQPLWRWAEGVMAQKWGEHERPDYVTTMFNEDYENTTMWGC